MSGNLDRAPLNPKAIPLFLKESFDDGVAIPSKFERIP